MVNNSTCIKLKTTDQELAVVHQPVLASGDVGTTRVEYELDHFWDGYALTGTFYASRLPNEVYEQPLTAGACVIPWEVLQDPDILYIGLRGVNGDGLVKTAAPVRYRIIKGSPCGTDTPMEPTPDVYQQLLAKTDTLERVVEESTIVCEAPGETVTIADASDQPLRGLKLFGKSVQNGTPTPENPVPIVSVGEDGKVDCKLYGGNLIQYPFMHTTKTQNGITFTDNRDGTITVNGTATENAVFYFSRVVLYPGTYTLAGLDGASGNTYLCYMEGEVNFYPQEKAVTKIITETATSQCNVIVYKGATVNGLVVRPMLNIGSVARPWECGKPAQKLTVSTPNGLTGIPVSSGGNYTDANGQQWICDEMDFARGVKVQRVDKVDMGTLGWAYDGNMFYAQVLGIRGSSNVLCVSYRDAESVYDFLNNSPAILAYFSYRENAVNVKDTAYTDVATFKASVSGVMLYYELATPVETPISETDLTAYRTLHTNKPNTTVYTDSNAGMTVAYAADTKTYIDNKFAELAAAVLQNA